MQTACYRGTFYSQNISVSEPRIDELEDKIRLLQARNQTLTEDNDDLRRDNELAARHNRENDYWQDNQEHLINTNKQLQDFNQTLAAKVEALEQ